MIHYTNLKNDTGKTVAALEIMFSIYYTSGIMGTTVALKTSQTLFNSFRQKPQIETKLPESIIPIIKVQI